MSTFQASLRELPDPEQASIGGLSRRLDLWMLAGIAIAVVAYGAGIASTGVSPTFFSAHRSAHRNRWDARRHFYHNASSGAASFAAEGR